MSAAKAASAVALDTRTGTRVAKTTESIAYDTAWGGASSGALKVNGTAVSGLSSKGAYSWTPNSEQTNYWALTYTAGTANYSATFKHSGYYAITYANTKGAANSNPAQYNIDSSITFTPLANVTGYVFNGWNPASIPAGGFGAKTVTAQWTPITYSVKFNKNGGTGTMADESFTYGTAKALTANAFTRTGYTFKGWATTSGATTANSNITLARALASRLFSLLNMSSSPFIAISVLQRHHGPARLHLRTERDAHGERLHPHGTCLRRVDDLGERNDGRLHGRTVGAEPDQPDERDGEPLRQVDGQVVRGRFGR